MKRLISGYIFSCKVLPNSTKPLGVEVLKSRGFFTQSKWYWIGVGALIGYTIVFYICYILALTFLNREFLHPMFYSEPRACSMF